MTKRRAIACIASLATLLFVITPAFADDGYFITEIITATDGPLKFDFPRNRYVNITNFLQLCGDTFGAVTVTKGGKTTTVLVATVPSEDPNGGREYQKNLNIAGPATLTVNPVPNGKLLITYRLGRNG